MHRDPRAPVGRWERSQRSSSQLLHTTLETTLAIRSQGDALTSTARQERAARRPGAAGHSHGARRGAGGRAAGAGRLGESARKRAKTGSAPPAAVTAARVPGEEGGMIHTEKRTSRVGFGTSSPSLCLPPHPPWSHYSYSSRRITHGAAQNPREPQAQRQRPSKARPPAAPRLDGAKALPKAPQTEPAQHGQGLLRHAAAAAPRKGRGFLVPHFSGGRMQTPEHPALAMASLPGWQGEGQNDFRVSVGRGESRGSVRAGGSVVPSSSQGQHHR